MTMMLLVTIDDDHDGHDDDVFVAVWGSFEASDSISFSLDLIMRLAYSSTPYSRDRPFIAGSNSFQ